MSGTSGESQPPRRPKPTTSRSVKSQTNSDSGEPSTFKPNPNRGTKTRSASSMPSDVDPGKGPTWYERILFGSVSSGQLAAFCRQFGAYLHAGVDINKTLASLQTQFSRTALGPVIGRLFLAVKRGETLAEAAAREPQAFDPLFLSMIKVAEARGGIPETLKSMSKHYEARQSLIRQARSAMIYPIAVIFVASCVVALLTIWLLPMFASLLRTSRGGRGVFLCRAAS